jgi:tRNA(adenine34) deaminase
MKFMTETELMSAALELARQAMTTGDVPVGAIVINAAGEIVGSGNNLREFDNDPTAHAEIVAMREAALIAENWRLDGHTLVVTLEPCAMCAGAIAQSRMKKVVFGAWDEKAGAVGSVWDILRDPRAPHKVEVVSGVLEEQCAGILKEFFQQQR